MNVEKINYIIFSSKCNNKNAITIDDKQVKEVVYKFWGVQIDEHPGSTLHGQNMLVALAQNGQGNRYDMYG